MKRITVMILVLGTLMVTAMPVLADEPKGGGANAKVGGMPLQWKATSPSTHEGDRYNLTLTNTGDEAQEARVRAFIMDHRNHTNTDVVDEQVELEPGETREFTALNDYGEASHFNTFVGSETRDLELAVAVTDAEGAETARFTDAAFTVQEKGNAGAKGKGKGKAADGHSHDEGFAALGDTARLAPLSLGLLATTGLGLYTVRRRRAWAVAGGERAESGASTSAWRTAAVVGLTLSAALHVGLVPAHFGEAAVQGVFFCAAGVIAAVLAAVVLVWPSRLAYLMGAGVSLVLIVLWAVFLVVPPPGAEAAEPWIL
ncbi:MAG: hypothetical protein M3N45_09195 [Actinomycetota bacterium]|nr:hypothetical protein [Actinomycetota bacterium]